MSLILKEVLEAAQGGSKIVEESSQHFYEVGVTYLFRTIGYHWLGKVVAIRGKSLKLEPATWVANTGRYNEALSGDISRLANVELEPSPRPVILNMDHVTDAVDYPFEFPKGAK